MNLSDSLTHAAPAPSSSHHVPKPPIERWVQPLLRLLRSESAPGIVLLLCTIVALVLANSPWAEPYAAWWKLRLRLGIGPWQLEESLLHVVNDGLMALFFFVVGLEIKREIVLGELREAKKATLPLAAALGGMIVPATIFLLLRAGQPGRSGWGIPMATDIAFVVGFLALFGSRVSPGLKILLLGLAVADDMGAVLVIALFYSTDVSLVPLLLAGIGFALTYLLRHVGVRRVPVYILAGGAIWFAFVQSGIHPTVAGVILGLMTPASAWVARPALLGVLAGVMPHLRTMGDRDEAQGRHDLGELEGIVREAVSPLDRLEEKLRPWIAFAIMPIFALANAGVPIDVVALSHPLALAVAAGLVVGKPLGIVLFSWLAVRSGLAQLPAGVNWLVLLGGGCLAGIGFTMSLFIAGLALDGALLDAGKIGTLVGSALSAVFGSLILLKVLPHRVRREMPFGVQGPHLARTTSP